MKKYPIKNTGKYKLAFTLFFVILPLALLGGAGFCVVAAVINLKIVPVDFDALAIGGFSIPRPLEIIAAVVLLALSILLFSRIRKYGSPSGYGFYRCSRAFNKAAGALLTETMQKYAGLSAGKYVEGEKETRGDLQHCLTLVRRFKTFNTKSDVQNKFEAAVFGEMKEARRALDAPGFSQEAFGASVQSMRALAEKLLSSDTPKSYQGNGTYAFVSYSHRDAQQVTKIIGQLQTAGIRLWFDEGITEGDDWMNHLARKIDGCAAFVMFQTTAYIRSANCLVEIKRAVKNAKTIIRVILDDCVLPEGLGMYLDAIQGIDCRAGLEGKLQRLTTLLKPASGSGG
ncbi:MAG: toll/interleukin-1 receptor domain-containing protein [Firmicutes bacterium]|nr:toll/interleukin-1 receptor domain-containing protein [Bacillota bacterium]